MHHLQRALFICCVETWFWGLPKVIIAWYSEDLVKFLPILDETTMTFSFGTRGEKINCYYLY